MISFLLEWTGTACVILAYGLNQFGVLASDSVWYMLLNFFGALFLLIILLKRKVWGPVMLQMVWSGVAFVSIIRYFFF